MPRPDSLTPEQIARLRYRVQDASEGPPPSPWSAAKAAAHEARIEAHVSLFWLEDVLRAAGATLEDARVIVKEHKGTWRDGEDHWETAKQRLVQYRYAQSAEQAYEALVDTITDRSDFSRRLLCAVRVLPPREAAMLFAAVDVHRSASAEIDRAQIHPTRAAHVSHQMRIYRASEAAVATLLELAEQYPTTTAPAPVEPT